jgi:hypothetical protein
MTVAMGINMLRIVLVWETLAIDGRIALPCMHALLELATLRTVTPYHRATSPSISVWFFPAMVARGDLIAAYFTDFILTLGSIPPRVRIPPPTRKHNAKVLVVVMPLAFN